MPPHAAQLELGKWDSRIRLSEAGWLIASEATRMVASVKSTDAPGEVSGTARNCSFDGPWFKPNEQPAADRARFP
jgi:hypothetical protein